MSTNNGAECVKVVVRCRPMNQRELDLNCENIIEVDSQRGYVGIRNVDDVRTPPKHFTFDGAYDVSSVTDTIYTELTFALVESVCEGYNGTVFAYGQTGCGKSFTMQGLRTVPAQKGIIPRSFEHIFEAITTETHKEFLIRASYLEIYNENIRDLLAKDAKQTLEMHENPDRGVYVKNLSWHECKKTADCEILMDKGNKLRSTGATLMNDQSSRSHSIFTITVEMCEKDEDGKEHYRVGKLNLVDLAGSERQSKTGATGDRLKEATKINLSLSALGNVISALVDSKGKGNTHIPYRDSKLTRLLQDSLGGNTKTLMIAAISPAAESYEETLSTLRYANRAKNIKNKPRINEDPKDALLRQLQEEIMALKAQLVNGQPTHQMTNGKAQIEEEKKKLKDDFERQILAIKAQYEHEKLSKETLQKTMDNIQHKYQSQLNTLQEREEQVPQNEAPDDIMTSTGGNNKSLSDPVKRLQKLQEMVVVGGAQANNEELKIRRNKRKSLAEQQRRARLAEAIDGDDNELMLSVYNSVQEEVKYKTKLLNREQEKVQFLEGEVKDLQVEFERDREDYLETIRRQERQLKLLGKILLKIQPLITSDCNYYNMDRIQAQAQWNEETQDWKVPDLQREKVTLPVMTVNSDEEDSEFNNNHEFYSDDDLPLAVQQQQQQQHHHQVTSGNRRNKASASLLNGRPRQLNDNLSRLNSNPNYYQSSASPLPPPPGSRELEIDRYRMKLENSQFDSSNYFTKKNSRQKQLLDQNELIRQQSGSDSTAKIVVNGGAGSSNGMRKHF